VDVPVSASLRPVSISSTLGTMIPGLSIRNARGFSLTLKADKARVTPGKGATFAGLKLTT